MFELLKSDEALPYPELTGLELLLLPLAEPKVDEFKLRRLRLESKKLCC